MNIIRPYTHGIFPILEDGLHTVALGNATQYEIAIMRRDRGTVIGIIGKGCYVFTHNAHPAYVQEKLKVGAGDADNVADFINCQTGCTGRVNGRYYSNLFHDEEECGTIQSVGISAILWENERSKSKARVESHAWGVRFVYEPVHHVHNGECRFSLWCEVGETYKDDFKGFWSTWKLGNPRKNRMAPYISDTVEMI